MQIRRLLRVDAVILTSFFLAIATYVGLYTFMLRGLSASVEIDPAKGTKTHRASPAYHRPQFLAAEWTETIARGFAPIQYVDTLVRPKRWPKDRVTALSPEALQEIADEMAAEAGENQRN